MTVIYSIDHYTNGMSFSSYESNKNRMKSWLLYPYLALIAWMPLPLGSKYPWAVSIDEVWCYLLACIALFHLLRYRDPLPKAFGTARLALILLALNLGWLLIQCIPFPLAWLKTLSPSAAALYSQAGVGHAPLSLDITTTLNHFQTAAFLFIFFCMALYLIDTQKKLKWLVYTVLISALFQVIYGSLMMLSGIEYSFFISKAALHSHIGSATGTFTNRDHLAGYLEMALSMGIGYMLTMLSTQDNNHNNRNWKRRIRQWSDLLLGSKARLRLLLILLCLGLVLTHSRGGNIGFFISIGVAGLLFLTFAQRKPRATIIFLTSLIILDIIIIGSWVGLSTLVNRLEKTTVQTEGRTDAYLSTLPMAQDYLITGIGAGNYFNVFPAYKIPQSPGYWNHAHNDYLEILVDQGLIGFSLLAGFVLCAFSLAIQTLRNRHSSFVLGMGFSSLMGIIALLIHSAVDFNLQILANSSMFMLILSIPFICRHHGVPQRQKDTLSPL